MAGIVTIYFEVIKSHQQSQESSSLKKELIDLSNTLTTMYQAEGTASLLAFAADNEKLKLEYDSLTHRVFEQIDSLQAITQVPGINQGLDSLSVLLLKKHDNALKMFELMKGIDKNVLNKFTKRTVISRSDADKLNSLLVNVTQRKLDTVKVVAEKKGFFQRVRDVVKTNNDTLTHILAGSDSETRALLVPVLSDTIIDFIRELDKNVKDNNSKILQQLLNRQHELYNIKELAAAQINMIMDKMKELEYQSSMNLLKENNESLKRSTSIVATVGILALVIVVFFMSWILQSLNHSQRLHKSIQEARKNAEKLLDVREQFIYTITHDIKVPISSIIGFLDLLREDTFSQKQQYYLNNMRSSASHILDLVHNLLDFHSIEKEESQISTVIFSPAALIDNIYESFLPLAQNKKLVLEHHSTLEETKTFLSDPNNIRQIVNNLISNAIKFSHEEGTVSIITSLDEKNQWKISVKDNGEGIDLADQSKIFDEFVRLNKTGKEEGTGLGLTISKHLAFLLGGTIEVESQKGAGSTFSLLIPLIPVPEISISQLDTTSDVSSVGVLFVDDDRVQLNLFSELMKREGLSCLYCSSAQEALNLLRIKPVDIILTDLHIPDMEGFELIKQIRGLDFPHVATIPIIALSAGCQRSESEIKAAGFSEFLLKPFTVQQLFGVIEKYTSFRRKHNDADPENGGSEWQRVISLVADDSEAVMKLIDSFTEETSKDKALMEIAFQQEDKESVKQISHKMLTLMQMISAQDIVSILTDFEKGDISQEKKVTLFRLLDEIIKEVKTKCQKIMN